MAQSEKMHAVTTLYRLKRGVAVICALLGAIAVADVLFLLKWSVRSSVRAF